MGFNWITHNADMHNPAARATRTSLYRSWQKMYRRRYYIMITKGYKIYNPPLFQLPLKSCTTSACSSSLPLA